MTTTQKKVAPLDQSRRPPCSVPLPDADLSLGNANWTKGLQAMSDWIWSGNLNPVAFPNNLGRYLLHIPGVFEQQLNYSATLIFDEGSFKNGVQIAGFVNRTSLELAINTIAQRRQCWYEMTHHSILSRLTANKHGLTEKQYTDKFCNLGQYDEHPECYTRVERAVIEFAHAFATNPKTYTDKQYKELRSALLEDNEARYASEWLWLARLEAAQGARAQALLKNASEKEADRASSQAAEKVSGKIPRSLNERKVDAQVVELAFVCQQFVALTCAFTGLNIPDEDFLPDVMMDVLPAPVIARINELNELALEGKVPQLAYGGVEGLNVDGEIFKAVLAGRVVVEPAPLKGAQIALTPYEGKDDDGNFRPAFLGMPDSNKGISVGGVQVGVYGWSFGGHFPGNLIYAMMHHPELSRYMPSYTLPVLFNEDEWRNGTQTAGYVSRRLKELAAQKVVKINCSRYGIEHHTMYLYNTFLDEHGVGRSPRPDFTDKQRKGAREAALDRAAKATLYIHDHAQAPHGVYTLLEKEVLSWTECLIQRPHEAHRLEQGVRAEFEKEDRREMRTGLRHLDTSPGIGEEAAIERLIDHQIAELAMMVGLLDGVGRAVTILRLGAEEPVQMVEGRRGPRGAIIPSCGKDGQVKFTGFFNNRPGLHEAMRLTGVNDAVLTLNELMVNPALCKDIKSRLKKGEKEIRIPANEAAKTGEF